MSTDDQLDIEFRSRLMSLENDRRSLEQEMHQLQHELRRVRDGIEREGGVGHSLEQRATHLEDNIKLCEHELNHNLKQQVGVSKQLKDLQKVINDG